METVISFVRHGEVYNPWRIFYGRLPHFRLSGQGYRQAEAAAEVLRSVPIAAILCSPLLRALQTAQVLRALHPGVALRVSQRLTEVYSPFEGSPVKELEARDWAIYWRILSLYEQPLDVFRRTQELLGQVRRDYPGQHVVVVTHGDVIAFMLLWASGELVAPNKKPSPYPAPASISTFRYRTLSPYEIPGYEYLEPCVGVGAGGQNFQTGLGRPVTLQTKEPKYGISVCPLAV